MSDVLTKGERMGLIEGGVDENEQPRRQSFDDIQTPSESSRVTDAGAGFRRSSAPHEGLPLAVERGGPQLHRNSIGLFMVCMHLSCSTLVLKGMNKSALTLTTMNCRDIHCIMIRQYYWYKSRKLVLFDMIMM